MSEQLEKRVARLEEANRKNRPFFLLGLGLLGWRLLKMLDGGGA